MFCQQANGGRFPTALLSSIFLALLLCVPETCAVRPTFGDELKASQNSNRGWKYWWTHPEGREWTEEEIQHGLGGKQAREQSLTKRKSLLDVTVDDDDIPEVYVDVPDDEKKPGVANFREKPKSLLESQSLIDVGLDDDDGDDEAVYIDVPDTETVEVHRESFDVEDETATDPVEEGDGFLFNFAYVRHGESMGNVKDKRYGDGRLTDNGCQQAEDAAQAVWEDHERTRGFTIEDRTGFTDDTTVPDEHAKWTLASFLVLGNRNDEGVSQLQVWVSPLRRALATAVIFYAKLLELVWADMGGYRLGKKIMPSLPTFKVVPQLNEKYKTRSEVPGVRTGADDPKDLEAKKFFTTPNYIQHVAVACEEKFHLKTGTLQPMVKQLQDSWLDWEGKTRGPDVSAEGPDALGLPHTVKVMSEDGQTVVSESEVEGDGLRAWMRYLPTTIEKFLANQQTVKELMVAEGKPILLVAHSGVARFASSGLNGLKDPTERMWPLTTLEKKIENFNFCGRHVVKLSNGGLFTGTVNAGTPPYFTFNYGGSRKPRAIDIMGFVGKTFRNYEVKKEGKVRSGVKLPDKMAVQYAMLGWNSADRVNEGILEMLPPGTEFKRWRVIKHKDKMLGGGDKDRIMTISVRDGVAEDDRYTRIGVVSFLEATERETTDDRRGLESVRNHRKWGEPTDFSRDIRTLRLNDKRGDGTVPYDFELVVLNLAKSPPKVKSKYYITVQGGPVTPPEDAPYPGYFKLSPRFENTDPVALAQELDDYWTLVEGQVTTLRTV